MTETQDHEMLIAEARRQKRLTSVRQQIRTLERQGCSLHVVNAHIAGYLRVPRSRLTGNPERAADNIGRLIGDFLR